MSNNQLAQIDKSTNQELQMSNDGSGSKLLPSNFAEIVQFGEMMAMSGTGLPKHLRDNAGACVRVIMQAVDWGMNPYGVADKTYFVNDKIGFEAQLITAVINTKAGLDGRMTFEYEGQGNTRKCYAKGIIDGQEFVYETPEIGQIQIKNSPLWKSDPDQQLSYYAGRGWARRYTPEVLLGVYAVDEIKDAEPFKSGRQIESEAGSRYSKPTQIAAHPGDIEATPNISDSVKKSIDSTQNKTEDTETLQKETPQNSPEDNAPSSEAESSDAEAPLNETTSASEQPDDRSQLDKAMPGIIKMVRLMVSEVDKRGDNTFEAVREKISNIFEKASAELKSKSYPVEIVEISEYLLDLVMGYCAFNEDKNTGRPLTELSFLASEKLGISEDDLLSQLYSDGGE